jgi:hypothetical protein
LHFHGNEPRPTEAARFIRASIHSNLSRLHK